MHSRLVYFPATFVPGVRKEWWGFDGKFVEDWKLWSREKSMAFGRKRDMLQVYGLKYGLKCVRFGPG